MNWRNSEKRILLSRIFELRHKKAFREMQEEVETALDRYPDDVLFQTLLVESWWLSGREVEAMAALDDLEEKAQQLDKFQSLKGSMLDRQGRHEKALEAYRSAHSLRPSAFYLKRQADCLLHLKRHREALALLRRCPDDDPYVLGALGRAWEGLDEREQALQAYKKILQIQPDDSYARSQLLRLRVEGKEDTNALRELDRMLRVPSRKNDPALLKVKADALKKQGDFGAAADAYKELVLQTRGPQKHFYRKAQAFAAYRAGRDEEAFSLLIELTGESPKDAYLRSSLISLARRTGRVSEVAHHFDELARRGPAYRFLFGVSRKLRRTLSASPADS